VVLSQSTRATSPLPFISTSVNLFHIPVDILSLGKRKHRKHWSSSH